MKKTISFLIVLLLLTSIYGVYAGQTIDTENNFLQQTLQITLSPPQLITQHRSVFVTLNEATSYIRETGAPFLPKITKKFVLPFKSTVMNVTVTFAGEKQIPLSTYVSPAPRPLLPDGSKQKKEPVSFSPVYHSSTLYPETPFEYTVTTGLEGKNHVMFLTVHCYPVRYLPVENLLYYYENLEITVEYTPPDNPVVFPDEYDLLVITPSDFESLLQPLVDHKNSHGMKTYLITLEELYSICTLGRDNQENIKLYIKNAIETLGVRYVLLVGGLKGQSKEWYLPVRYGHSLSEDAYISDLYYADIYKYENGEVVFEDWDSNGNGKFAEFSLVSRDQIDGAPDVYVGRLACRSSKQVEIMVNKIINYEKQPADESWFKRMLLIGGDTYPESSEGFEAEIDTNLSASYMPGFVFERLWASLGTLTGQEDVEIAMNQGAGFIHMAGHANPPILVTFPPYDKEKEHKIVIMQMYNFLDPFHVFPKLRNNEKLPIIVVGGCHNSQFNVSLMNILRDIVEYGVKKYFFEPPYRFYYMEWVPKCWSWWLTSKEDGGAIATMGNTGLGMGLSGYNYTKGLDGWLFPRFFYHYGIEGEHNIGMAHGAAITDYVNEFNINKDGDDRQMVQQWVLLGDPSLLPGGYS